jgi:hypothetical protein
VTGARRCRSRRIHLRGLDLEPGVRSLNCQDPLALQQAAEAEKYLERRQIGEQFRMVTGQIPGAAAGRHGTRPAQNYQSEREWRRRRCVRRASRVSAFQQWPVQAFTEKGIWIPVTATHTAIQDDKAQWPLVALTRPR